MSDTLLEFTKLSRAIEKLLVENNLVTVQDVATITDAELLRLPNLGRRKLAQIRAVIPWQPGEPEPETEESRLRAKLADAYRELALANAYRIDGRGAHERDKLYFQTILAKCARNFRERAQEASDLVHRRGSNCDELATMDVFVHNTAMAMMCEEALKR